jgi:hypothetical protein
MSLNKDRFQDVQYIGDGAYAGHDSFQVWVWASDGIHDTPPVALESGAMQSLVDYARRVGVLRS